MDAQFQMLAFLLIVFAPHQCNFDKRISKSLRIFLELKLVLLSIQVFIFKNLTSGFKMTVFSIRQYSKSIFLSAKYVRKFLFQSQKYEGNILLVRFLIRIWCETIGPNKNH